jgi:hypothetical protein
MRITDRNGYPEAILFCLLFLKLIYFPTQMKRIRLIGNLFRSARSFDSINLILMFFKNNNVYI